MTMAKMEFKKDPSRKKVEETKISKPIETFNLETIEKKQTTESQTRIGRPPKNKEYSSLRVQKINVQRINALQNTLEYDTQDDILDFLISRAEYQLDAEQRIMFDMYMKAYQKRNNKKRT